MIRRRWLVWRVFTLGGGRVIAACISAAWLIVAARRLPVDTYGDLLLLLGLGLLLQVVHDAGLPLALTDAVLDDPAVGRSAFVRVLARRLSLGVAAAALVTIAYVVASGRPDLMAAAIFSVSIIATAVHSTAVAVFRGHGKVRADAANDAVSRIFVAVLGSWWLLHGGGLRAAVAVYALADVASLVVMGVMAWRTTAGADEPVDVARFSLLRIAPVALATGLGVLYYRVDLWLLALIKGPREVALYGSAYRVLDGILLVATAVAVLSVPAVARAADQPVRKVLGRLVMLSLVVTLPLAVVGFVGADPIVRSLFGARYIEAAGLLRLLLLAAVPSAIVIVVAPLAFLRGRSGAVKGFTVVLALNVGLNLALMPPFGAAGAALVTFFCQVGLAAWLWRSVIAWSAVSPVTPAVARAPAARSSGVPAPASPDTSHPQVISSIRSRATRAPAAVSGPTVI